jgi:hypothetical protein
MTISACIMAEPRALRARFFRLETPYADCHQEWASTGERRVDAAVKPTQDWNAYAFWTCVFFALENGEHTETK